MESKADKFLEQIPTKAELRQRIAENLAERNLLRTLLRIAEKREVAQSLKGAVACK